MLGAAWLRMAVQSSADVRPTGIPAVCTFGAAAVPTYAFQVRVGRLSDTLPFKRCGVEHVLARQCRSSVVVVDDMEIRSKHLRHSMHACSGLTAVA